MTKKLNAKKEQITTELDVAKAQLATAQTRIADLEKENYTLIKDLAVHASARGDLENMLENTRHAAVERGMKLNDANQKILRLEAEAK
jgi:chromosome segregation ATPase